MYRLSPALFRIRSISLSLLVVFAFFAAAGSAAGSSPIFSASFDSGRDSFEYEDDLFRATREPDYARGHYKPADGHAGGGLSVVVGGVDDVDVLDGMSGGWRRSFFLPIAGNVEVTLRYRLIVSGRYEAEECGEALLAIDGVLVSGSADDYLDRRCGVTGHDPAQDTGWQQVSFELPLSAGTHTLAIGAWNNQKNARGDRKSVV